MYYLAEEVEDYVQIGGGGAVLGECDIGLEGFMYGGVTEVIDHCNLIVEAVDVEVSCDARVM